MRSICCCAESSLSLSDWLEVLGDYHLMEQWIGMDKSCPGVSRQALMHPHSAIWIQHR